MIKALALAALLLASPARALISVMEALPTTKDAVYVGTTTPQLLLNGGTFYAGTVPNVSMAASSNVVVGNCVVYASGTIQCLGVHLSTTDPAGTYVPYTGAITDVNLGTHKMLAAQFGAGTTPSTNFLFDGLSAGSAYARVTAGTNLATGYYWGGTRGYSMQERYDLTGTPFTLHDELNNVDRFYLDTSGAWYFPLSTTVSSLTVLSASVGISGATENVNASMIGNGSLGASLGVSPSSVAVLNASGFIVNAQIDHSSVPFLVSGLINNSQIDVSSIARLNSSGLISNYQIDSSSVVKFGANTLIQDYQIDPSSVNKVIGVSSGPAGAGQFLENATIRNGVVTGGDFASAGSGSGNETGLSSQTFTTASSVSFGLICNAVSSPTVSCEVSGVWNTSAGNFNLTFNGDTTSGHYANVIFASAVTGTGGTSSNSTSNIQILNDPVVVGGHFDATWHYIVSGGVTNPQYTFSEKNSSNNLEVAFGGGWWTVAGYPSSGTITTSAGTITGFIRCKCINF